MMEKDSSKLKRVFNLKKEDNEFAEGLAQEFGLPLDDLKEFIGDIHDAIQNGYPIIKLGYYDGVPITFVEPYHRLFEYDLDIRKISIETNKGIIEFYKTDTYFALFIAPLKKIRRSVRQALSKFKKMDERHERSCILEAILKYFHCKDSLNKTTVLYATGLFMLHFKLFGYKPILKKEDFTDDYGAWDYKHYLVDIVKRRLARTIHRIYIDDPAFEKFKKTDDYKKWLQSWGDDGCNDDLKELLSSEGYDIDDLLSPK